MALIYFGCVLLFNVAFCPVVFVSYEKALSYLEWLGKKYPQYSFRLPSMEEWEYAASGGKDNDFSWGKNADGSRFNCNANAASKYLKNDPVVMIVNEKSPDYGHKMRLSQMISVNNGRVSGWIDHKNHSGFVYTDLFRKIMDDGGNTTAVNSYHKGKSPFGVYDMSGNAWEWTSTAIIASNGAEKGKQAYAIKGGSWYANANSCKITMRGEGRLPKLGYNTVGFRIAAEKIKIDGK